MAFYEKNDRVRVVVDTDFGTDFYDGLLVDINMHRREFKFETDGGNAFWIAPHQIVYKIE